MNSRDRLILAGIIGGLILTFFLTRYLKPERVRPGTPEYEAYIQQYVDECLKAPASYSIPATISPAELEPACRAAVLQADRFNPSARPLKH
jgi:hypothetical protein